MKYIFGVVTFIICSLCFFSCDNLSENTDSLLTDTLAVDTMPEGFAAYSSKFQILLQNDSSFFRGKILGMNKADVTEASLTKIETDETDITYTVPLEATEEADIIYAFDTKNKLASIDVIFYPQNDSSLQAFKTEMIDYYSKKLNALVSIKDNKSTLLSPATNTGIEWTEEGNAQIKDLHMRIFALSSL